MGRKKVQAAVKIRPTYTSQKYVPENGETLARWMAQYFSR